MDCSLPGSSAHEILKARILEWVPFPPGDLPDPGIELVSLTSVLIGGFFTTSATWEAQDIYIYTHTHIYIYNYLLSGQKMGCSLISSRNGRNPVLVGVLCNGHCGFRLEGKNSFSNYMWKEQ